jgi:hypothetical protein
MLSGHFSCLAEQAGLFEVLIVTSQEHNNLPCVRIPTGKQRICCFTLYEQEREKTFRA